MFILDERISSGRPSQESGALIVVIVIRLAAT